MSVISISRAFCSKGKLIAEQVAKKLGYECISREIILEASDVFNVAEVKLAKAIHDGPSFLEKITHGKDKYIAYIKAALLNNIKRNNIVYHGLAGHFFLQGIQHVVKIRIITDFESRVSEEMARENITGSLARKILLHDDAERLKWSKYIHGVETNDPDLYDLILNLKQMSVDDCTDLICHVASFSSFQTTIESKRKLNNLAMAANARALIIDKYHDAAVNADDGSLNIVFSKKTHNRHLVVSDIERLLKTMTGIKKLDIKVEEDITPGSLMYMAKH